MIKARNEGCLLASPNKLLKRGTEQVWAKFQMVGQLMFRDRDLYWCK